MGAVEAINACELLGDRLRGVLLISPTLIHGSDASYEFSMKEVERITSKLAIPSLWITSEGDMMALATYRFFEMTKRGGNMHVLVECKDSLLDRHETKAFTHQTTAWGKMINGGNGIWQVRGCFC